MIKAIFLAGMCVLPATLPAAELLGDENNQPRRPRVRLASAPYPNLLFKRLEKIEFGEHHYRPDWRPWKTREISRGHFYTRQGGFVDLSHLRKTVDWAAYFQAHIYHALSSGETDLVLKGSEPSLYKLRLDLPDLAHLSEEEKDGIHKELSIKAGISLSYTALTWHEILTWYGYSALRVLSEKASAFSYEDMYTHALGASIAGQALRDSSRPYNEAVSEALKNEITLLEPLDGTGTQDALNRVHKVWWKYHVTLKRSTDIGESGYVAPMLVPDIDTEGAKLYPTPVIGDVHGIDMSNAIITHIQPRLKVGIQMSQMIDRESGLINPVEDFSLFMKDIRSQIAEEKQDKEAGEQFTDSSAR